MSEAKLYYEMLRIRRIEEEIARRYPEGRMRCPVHLSIGQEACAVGMAAALNKDDLMVSTHRGHAHYLAKGGSLRGLLCELYGKADGCSRGQGGSMHLVDRSVGFCGSTSIVGGTIPVGVGLAFAKKLQGASGVVVVCIGDAAIEEGTFHESANFAGLHKLPVIFLLENNRYSCYTDIKERQPDRSLHYVAGAHGLSFIGDYFGQDAIEVNHHAKQAVDRALTAPVLFVLNTYRYREHCGPNEDDNLEYRPFEEREYWRSKDPLQVTKQTMLSNRSWTKELVESFDEIEKEIEQEFAYAKAAPFPDQSELGKYLYATNS